MRFIHTADVHLDSPLLRLNRYDGAPVEAFRSATRRAFENLVGLAIEKNVDFVLIAGDLYDGECKDMNTPIAFRKCLRELGEHGIDVYIVQGNHDAQSKVSKAFRLDPPKGTHIFGTRSASTVTFKVGEQEVAIHGQGFATAAVEDNLAADYPDAVAHHFNIGLLHTNCGGSSDHGNYAPSTVAQLVTKNYDYWALGHVHKRQVLHERQPWIGYPGNLQGRSMQETGEKGCSLVTVEGGEVIDVAFHCVDHCRWEAVRIDASECKSGREVVSAVMQGIADCLDGIGDRLLATRVEVTGASQAHGELTLHERHFDDEIRSTAVNRFDEQVWVEKIRFRTRLPAEVAQAEIGDGALAGLLDGLCDNAALHEAFAEVTVELDALRAEVPTDPRLDEILPDLEDAEVRAKLLDDVKQLLVPRLVSGGRS